MDKKQEFINCNNCEHMLPKEEDQVNYQPHMCKKYAERCYHHSQEVTEHGVIYPCTQCIDDGYRNYSEVKGRVIVHFDGKSLCGLFLFVHFYS